LRPWLAAAAVVAFAIGSGVTTSYRRAMSPAAAPPAFAPPAQEAVTAPSPAGTTPARAQALAAADLVLAEPLLRASGGPPMPRLTVGKGRTTVTIEVAVEGRGFGAGGQAALRTVEGDEMWTGQAVPAPRTGFARVVLPASAMPPGDYMIRVTAGGGASAAGGALPTEYPFRVLDEATRR
jgi:hypothetical protein